MQVFHSMCRFGLGKVHEQLKLGPPPPPVADVPVEEGDEGNSTTSEEHIPLEYPVDLTEPVYRYDKTSSFLYMVP